jgi:hypothetical protein
LLDCSEFGNFVITLIATSRASDIGVACENGMYFKQVETGTKSKTCVDKTDKTKPKRQENKMYMGFDNEKVSPVRRPNPDFVFDNNYITQRRKKHQTKPIDEACDKHITHENGSLGTKSSSLIKPATYDRNSPWLDHMSHFDVCAKINDWTDTEKGLCLAVSLRVRAQGVLGNLPLNARQDFDELIRSLEERFSPSNQTELYRTQLRERCQKAAESLPELGQDVRRLTNLAYPTAPNDVREILAKEQFVDGLASADMRLCVKQARPLNFNDAVRYAVELEAFNKAERKRDDVRGYLRTTSETNQTHDCDTPTLTLIKNMQTMLSELQ